MLLCLSVSMLLNVFLACKNAQMEAEISYNRIFELCKSSIGKKSFDSFFKNVKMVQGGVNKEEKKDKFEHKNSQEYNSGNETFDMNNLVLLSI